MSAFHETSVMEHPNDSMEGIPSAPPGARVRITGIHKSFAADKPVLSGIDLELKPGELVAVIGRSGCGKSTLLRLLAGLEKADEGEILVNDEALLEMNPDTRVMFQESRLMPWLSVIDNVALGLPPEKRSQAEHALHEVGLSDRAQEWPSNLSGGQRQRVALARALASEPRLLLLDEPLGALDALTRRTMHRLIEDVWRQHRFTALLVTHDVEEAVSLADRVILIDEGRVSYDVRVELSRPRNRANLKLVELREQILSRIYQEEPHSP